jgi:iron complex transport system substrate-binding protein
MSVWFSRRFAGYRGIRVIAYLLVVFIPLGVEARPRRIVSTLPSATETLFALGVGKEVVGVSAYCRFPKEALSLPKVGSYMKPNAELIAALRPDLVIVEKTALTLVERLSALGVQCVELKIGSLEDIYSMIEAVGSAVGFTHRAESLNKRIRTRLEMLRSETSSNRNRPSVLLIVGRTPGLLTNLVAAGPSTYLNELLEIAGGQNALQSSSPTYPHISLETVMHLNPKVILDASAMREAGQTSLLEENIKEAWLAHTELTAVKTGLVFALSSQILVTPGPRVAEAVEEIRSRLLKAVPQQVRP